MGFVGYKFTWLNISFGGNLVRERIDRGLPSSEWRMNYPEARIMHLDNNGSDHNPILLDANPPSFSKKRRFKFQERWCEAEEVQKIVKDVCSVDVVGSPMFQFFHKLKHCRHKLVNWQKAGSSNSREKIAMLKDRLASLKEGRQVAMNEEVTTLEDELSREYEKEERFWREKSRINWLR